MIKLSDYLDTPSMGEVIAGRKAADKKQTKRHYAGAKISRLNSGWTTGPLAANYEIRTSLRILRARARQLAHDNSHFKRFLTLCRSNIIGPAGIRLQVRALDKRGKLDKDLNKHVENAFWEWTFKENCTASGKLDWLAAQNLFVTHLARDGEVLVQKVSADNPFGFALKFINVDYLDETFNEELRGGNRIIMSVEVDQNDKPVAFWLTTPASDYMFRRRDNRHRIRVPAEEMIHAFLIYDDETQTRGVTWFHSAMIDAKHLHGYKEGVITSARASASSFGMLLEEQPEIEEFTGEEDEYGNEKNIEIDVNPLSMNIVPAGYRFEQFDPKQPTQNHPAFYKSILMDVSAGLDVHYFNLSGDMEAVNYSSARVGLNEDRDLWKKLQQFASQMFCREVYHGWAKSAFLNGKLKLNAREFKEIQNPMWRSRGWTYVDPLKEENSNTIALENKTTTWTDILAGKGVDFIEHLETMKQEQELAKEYGIELKTAAKGAMDKKKDEEMEKE